MPPQAWKQYGRPRYVQAARGTNQRLRRNFGAPLTTAAFSAAGAGEPEQPQQSAPAPCPYASLPAPLARRMRADPNFLYKLLVEIAIDETTIAAVNISARGNPLGWTTHQALQVLSQAFNASLNDSSLVWFLAPKAARTDVPPLSSSSTGAPRSSRLPTHAFEPGNFSVPQRVLAVLQKTVMYSFLGAFNGSLSLMLSTAILLKTTPDLSHLCRAAVGGIITLGISSNIRYNIVNGIEVLIYSRVRENVARLGTIMLRTLNIYAGARIFITIARLVGW